MSLFGRREQEALRAEGQRLLDRAGAAEAEAARLRASLDAVPAGIVVADERGEVVFRNPGAARGGHVDVLVDEIVERLLREAIVGHAAEQRLSVFGPPPRVLAVRALPLARGGAIAVIDDLTERTRLDSVRTDFVANISHELKTPVAAIALLAEALADCDDIEVHRHLAGKMVDEAHRAAGTIDDLMELSRIELGAVVDPEPVSVAGIVGEAVARHRLTAETARVAIEIGSIGDIEVLGDRLQLVSAIANLVDNAVKYSNCEGKVRVDAWPIDDAVEITVADRGVGIPAKDLDRIFERFYRVDRARSRDTGGTGLGLAIVRHVATNHGGEVTVTSREGEGSVFTLRLPAPLPVDRE
ncbi:MAG TPA: ATP-binding protein [Ilumatobacteraceae bacterium]|nr:ATP-binding protein [Ilumatobacteraceae bacterium]